MAEVALEAAVAAASEAVALAEAIITITMAPITTDLITEDIGDRVAITEAEAVLEE